MEKIKKCIEIHLLKIKTISDVARLLNVSKETLRKAFLRQEKIPLGDYILYQKVLFMKELLLVTKFPCNVICFNAGLLEDHGARIFKKITGVTMQQFRFKSKPLYESGKCIEKIMEQCETDTPAQRSVMESSSSFLSDLSVSGRTDLSTSGGEQNTIHIRQKKENKIEKKEKM